LGHDQSQFGFLFVEFWTHSCSI